MADTNDRLTQALRERDEYAAQVHELTERCARMTSAATMAAGTAEAAIRKLQRAEPLIQAAYAFSDDSNSVNKKFALDEAVETHREGAPS